MSKICPYCAEEIKDEAIKCKFCHSMLGKIKNIQNNSNVDEEVLIIKKQDNVQKENTINNENFIYIISGILILIMIISIGIAIYFYGPNVIKSLSNSSIKIESNISKELKEENSNFRLEKSSEDEHIYNVTYDYNTYYKIDINKLLDACGENNSCYDQHSIKLNTNAPFIIKEEKEKIPKIFIINFVNIPNQDDIIKARQDVFEKFKISFGDSLIIKVKSVDNDPLKLIYEIPKLNFEVTNKTKNPKKTIILGLDNTNIKNDTFSYEEKKEFFTKNEFDSILNLYLSSLQEKYIQNVDFISYINSSLEIDNTDSKIKKYHDFIINSNITYPVISYGRTLDEKSCLSWKKVVTNHNKTIDEKYTTCLNDGGINCNKYGKWSGDYGNYYIGEINKYYPRISEGVKIIGLNTTGIGEINNSVCKSELEGVLKNIKNNLTSN